MVKTKMKENFLISFLFFLSFFLLLKRKYGIINTEKGRRKSLCKISKITG